MTKKNDATKVEVHYTTKEGDSAMQLVHNGSSTMTVGDVLRFAKNEIDRTARH